MLKKKGIKPTIPPRSNAVTGRTATLAMQPSAPYSRVTWKTGNEKRVISKALCQKLGCIDTKNYSALS
ncbi:hypothetical protein [Salinivibrio sp. PR5]|uniref:hypothetical protein n=1 Tax=Salinivibrio sp. PR5 TaxID=1909484 RepID=UPI003FD29874